MSEIKRKTMMIPYIPWELEWDILSRVPATSLKQWRLICKRWDDLFKDPRFIKKNIGRAATQMVLKKDQSVYSFSFDLHGIHNRYDQFIKFTGRLESLKNSEDVKISDIFHCGGLLLCTTKDNRVVVWNPCTGQTRWIQPRLFSTMHHYTYFLGRGNKNKSCDSYKILSFDYHRDDQNDSVGRFEIYEFDSDSWRVLDGNYIHKWGVISRGVSLKGDTYWLDADDEENYHLVNCVVRFDFTTERFGRLPLPFQGDFNFEDSVLSVVREEKLAVLHQMVHGYSKLEMKIWVSNTKTDEAKDLSWTTFLVVDLGKFMINNIYHVMSFFVDEENKRVMCCDCDDHDKTRIYIVGEDIHKQVYREFKQKTHFRSTVSTRSSSPRLVSYVPSLVQIPARQSTPGDKR